MGFRARLTFIGEVEDGDAKNDSIPLVISKLKTAFLPADFERAERALLGRESNLKREIEKLKKENAALQESNQFRELEMLRIETELKEYKTKGVIFELRRKNRELESEKVKLEALVKSEYEGWKGLISKLERDASHATKLSNEKGLGSTKFEGRSRNCGRIDDSGRNNLGVVIKSENGLDLNENGGMASSAGSSIFSEGHTGLKLSGIRELCIVFILIYTNC